MTGLFPSGADGPAKLVENQTVIAQPPIYVERFAQINTTLNMQALPMNFQTVPIHSDAGNLNSTVFQGYDANMCPILGEMRMYELANASNAVNSTFQQHTAVLYQLF